MNSLLKDIIPTELRTKLYAVYAILALALGAVQVGFASSNAGQPEWLTTTLAVFVFLGAGLGLTAQANPTGHPVAASAAPAEMEVNGRTKEQFVAYVQEPLPIPVDPDTPLYYATLDDHRP